MYERFTFLKELKHTDVQLAGCNKCDGVTTTAFQSCCVVDAIDCNRWLTHWSLPFITYHTPMINAICIMKLLFSQYHTNTQIHSRQGITCTVQGNLTTGRPKKFLKDPAYFMKGKENHPFQMYRWLDGSIVVKGHGSLPSVYTQIDRSFIDLMIYWWSLFIIFLLTKQANSRFLATTWQWCNWFKIPQ